MAEEGKGVALAILGIVAVLAVVGLVMLYKGGAVTGKGIYGGDLTRGPQYETGFVRDSTNRVFAGANFVYPERHKDTGDGVPSPTYDQDYKRTGPWMDNPCPYPPYTDKVTALYATGRECTQSEMPGYEDFLCCV